nr:ribosomal lysine n-methyltransferase set10 [Quercus suber]
MEDWLRANGGFLHPSLSIAHSATSGLHWRANGPIPAGTSLITVPHGLALSYLNALVDDAYPVFQKQRRRFKVENIGFFYLMVQYVNREKSFWKPYLDLLPQPSSDLCTPLWFREQHDLDWLEGTDVLHTAKGRLEIYEQYYATGVEVLHEAGIDSAPYTWDLFIWAVTMFTSRSFSSNAIRPQESKYWTTYKQALGSGRRQAVLLDMSHTPAEDLDFPVLFPVLDAGNHRIETKVDWTFDPGRFTVTSLEDSEAGQEVYNNYGAWKSNSELFMGYGFCIPGNPNETVMLTLKPPPADLQAHLRAFHPGYFHPNGDWAGEKATFHVQASPPSTISGNEDQIFTNLPEPLLEILLYMLMHERHVPITFIEKPHEFLLSPAAEAGSHYKPFVARALVQSLAPKLAKLESDPLPPQPANARQAAAAVYRAGQLAILRTTIAALKAFTRSLLKPPAAPGPRVLDLESLLDYFAYHTATTAATSDLGPDPAASFLSGIAASAGTRAPARLRAAGWEQDVLVLLLGYMLLHATSPDQLAHPPAWLPSPPQGLAFPLPDSDANADPGDSAAAHDLLAIVHTAAAAAATTDPSAENSSAEHRSVDDRSAGSKRSSRSRSRSYSSHGNRNVWADARWSAAFIARYGGALVRTCSFAMMVPGAAAAGARSGSGTNRPSPFSDHYVSVSASRAAQVIHHFIAINRWHSCPWDPPPDDGPDRNIARHISEREGENARGCFSVLRDKRLVGEGDAVGDGAVGVGGVVTVAGVVEHGLLELGALDVEEGGQLAPAVVAGAALGQGAAEGDGALVEEEVDVGGGRAGGEVAGAADARGVERARRVDDLDVEARAEGLHVRDDERPVRKDVVRGQEGGELGQAEGGDDGHDVGVVGEVEVQALVGGEGAVVVVERHIDLGGRRVDGVVLQPGEDLFDVADADGAAGGRLEGVVAGEREIDGVLVALPLVEGEETAEGGVTERDRLVRAQRLRIVRVGDGPGGERQHSTNLPHCRGWSRVDSPVETRSLSGKSLGGVGEVDVGPGLGGIGATGGLVRVGVVTVVVPGQRVVPDARGGLDGEDQGGVLGPLETEEAGQEVLGRLGHAVLGGGAGDDLLAIVRVEVAVLVLVEGAGLEESGLDVSFLCPSIDSSMTRRLWEAQVAGERHVAQHAGGVVEDLGAQLRGPGAGGRVAGAVAGQHVHLHDRRIGGQGVLVDAEALGVGEVVGELAHLLEDVAIGDVAGNGDLGLEGAVRDVGGAGEGRRVGLGEEGRLSVLRDVAAAAAAVGPEDDSGVDADGRGGDEIALVEHDELDEDEDEDGDLAPEQDGLGEGAAEIEAELARGEKQEVVVVVQVRAGR